MCAILLACLTGCSNQPAEPSTVPPPANVIDNFIGTLAVNATASHRFTMTQRGLVSVTLSRVGPPATVTVGLGFGTWTDPVCTVAVVDTLNTTARATPQFVGTAPAGNYCVAISDVGAMVAPVDYFIFVAHP